MWMSAGSRKITPESKAILWIMVAELDLRNYILNQKYPLVEIVPENSCPVFREKL